MVAFTMNLFQTPHLQLPLIVLFTIIGGGISFFLIRFFERKKIQKKIKIGIECEHEAAHFLKKNRYTIVAYHTSISYTIQENGKNILIPLELDYVVSKNGKTYVAEVKSGEHTATIRYAQTRRQLLEYAVATKYDGYLLIDMHHKTINSIEFPLNIRYRIPSLISYGILLLGIAVFLVNFAFKEYNIAGNIAIITICIFWFWKLSSK